MKKIALCVKSSLKSGSEYFGALARQTKKKKDKKNAEKKNILQSKPQGKKCSYLDFLKYPNKFLNYCSKKLQKLVS